VGRHGVEPGRRGHGQCDRAVVWSSGTIESVREGKGEGALSTWPEWVEVVAPAF
jgi:hypothetical protein